MKRIWGHVMSLVVVGMAASAVVPACATNDQTIFIRNALAPALNRQASGCVYTSDPTQPALFEGKLDVGITDSYQAILLVGNQLVARGDPTNGPRAETSRVHITGAVVRVTETDGSLIHEFTSLANGFADPGANSQPTYATVGVTAIDVPTRDIIVKGLANRLQSKTVVANIKAFGTTLGGQDVESGEYQLPIQVCNGCLVDFAGANDETAMKQPNCLKPQAMATTVTTAPCSIGQDERVPCQLCVATRPACDPANP